MIQGAGRKGYSFDRQWEKGAALLFPEFAPARGAARVLVLRAMLAKRPADAARDLRAAARLASDVGSEPTVIAYLVEAAMEGAVQRGVRAVGARGGAWTAAVRPVAEGFGPLPDLHRPLAGEAVFGRKIIDDLVRKPDGFSSGNDAGAPTFALSLGGFRPVRDAFEARTIEHWRAVWAALPRDPIDWRASKRAVALPIPEGPSRAALQITAPVFSSLGDVVARLEAERRLTRAALDLWSGKAPALPKDPFGAGSLKLRREGKGWTLWSLGPDAVDQGGKTRNTRSNDGSYDLVVTSSDR